MSGGLNHINLFSFGSALSNEWNNIHTVYFYKHIKQIIDICFIII